ncbi:MAG: DNA primase [Clostridiales bacterium]|nr:DNA primase [Clostridiales bacterium]
MALPELFLQELKMRNDMVEVASSYVNLKRSGRNFTGLCPFHNEKTPSFHIYTENNTFYCFGCGAGGDVITFIRRIENLDYMESIRFLADRAGLQVPENAIDDGMAKLKGRILEINRESARFFHAQLWTEQGKPALDYLLGRGLTSKTIRHFGLGYSLNSRFGLVDHLKKKGYTSYEIVQSNVAFESRTGKVMDRFFSRVMFPIIDLRGNVVGFGGRILTDEKPKYLNTSDTLAFKKSNGLFAMNFAKNSNPERLILVEGYMDVIALHQAGFPNAVATLGTALTSEQAKLMARYVKEVVISYDADEAGQKAASRAIHLLREAGLLVKVLSIEGGKDPDEFIRSFGDQGPARFKHLIESSGNDMEYRLRKLKSQCDMQMPEGKVAYLNGAAELLAELDNRMEQEIYAGRLAEEMEIDRISILLQVDKNRKKAMRSRKKKEFREIQQQITGMKDTVNPEKKKHLRAANAEEGLLACLFRNQDGQQAQRLYEKLPPEKFCTGFNRRVYETIMGKIMSGNGCELADISGDFSVEEISGISRILARYDMVPLSSEDAEEYSDIILQEYQKLCAENVESAQPQDIQEYLQKLREQKK